MTAPAEFLDAMRAHGLEPPAHIEPGKFYRFPGSGKRRGNDAGWCKLFDDGAGGIFGDLSADLSETWQARRAERLSEADRDAFRRHVEKARREREADELKRRNNAANKARTIWDKASPCESHPYLTRKGIEPCGVRVDDAGRLVLPRRNAAGGLRSVQFIDADGGKKYQPGGEVRGTYFAIAGDDAVPLYVCEGFATGASIHAATGGRVAVAFDCGNLEAVACALREKYPDARIVLCADDDTGTAGNPGKTKAHAAALAVGGRVALPDFGDARPDGLTDFNDLHALLGLEAVRACVDSASAEEQPAPEIPTAYRHGGNAYAPEIRIERGDALQIRPVRWLWPGWLAAGKLHILGGAPGTGKTTLALAMAATVTTGGAWPDGKTAPLGNVVVWSGEDDPADTLLPRLVLSGGDPSRAHFIRDVLDADGARGFDPARDMRALAAALDRIGDVRLLIVDPIVSAVAGDSHKNAEVRRALAPLVELAERIGCAMVGITHFSKGTAGRDPTERITGSLAFGALARVVLVAAKHQTDDGGEARRVLLRAKSNIGPDDGGFAYALQQGELTGHPGVVASCAVFGEAIEGAARDILAEADATDDGADGDSLADAKRFLLDLLADRPLPSKQVRADADGAGYSWSTIRRAQKALGIESRKEGGEYGGKGAVWKWYLPLQEYKMLNEAQEAQQKNVGNLCIPEHLVGNPSESAPADRDDAEVF